jgi:hypothetical protein
MNIWVVVGVAVASVAVASRFIYNLVKESHRQDLVVDIVTDLKFHKEAKPNDVLSSYELTNLTKQWLNVRLPNRRKRLLIHAGVPIEAATSDETAVISDEALVVLAALRGRDIDFKY